MNLILIGYRGTGKTSLGKKISKKLKMNFLDTDDWIVNHSGLSIPDIFSKYGEKHFRELEKKAVNYVSELDDTVVSTGGGIILDSDNRSILSNSGYVVWLKADSDIIHKRINNDSNRPALTDFDPVKEIRILLDKRNPLYKNTSDIEVETGSQKFSDSMIEIINSFQQQDNN